MIEHLPSEYEAPSQTLLPPKNGGGREELQNSNRGAEFYQTNYIYIYIYI
jgi:hypothetical protein